MNGIGWAVKQMQNGSRVARASWLTKKNPPGDSGGAAIWDDPAVCRS